MLRPTLLVACLLCFSGQVTAAEPDIREAVYLITIETTAEVTNEFNETACVHGTSYGTGTIINKNGDFLTCAHVARPENLLRELLARTGSSEAVNIKNFIIKYKLRNHVGRTFRQTISPKTEKDGVGFALSYETIKDQVVSFKKSSTADIVMMNIKASDLVSFPIEKEEVTIYPMNGTEAPSVLYALAIHRPEKEEDPPNITIRVGHLMDPYEHRVDDEKGMQLLMTVQGGDSGSLICDESWRPVGVVFAKPSAPGACHSFMIPQRTLIDFAHSTPSKPLLPPQPQRVKEIAYPQEEKPNKFRKFVPGF